MANLTRDELAAKMAAPNQANLDAAFAKLQQGQPALSQDWRADVDSIVLTTSKLGLLDTEVANLVAAVAFFCGTDATVTREPGQGRATILRVRATGYRNGPAGS